MPETADQFSNNNTESVDLVDFKNGTNLHQDVQNCKELSPTTRGSLSPAVYAVLAASIASIGGILYGYDIGCISGALLMLRNEFNLTSFKQEMVVSSILVGSLCGAFFAGFIVDQFGRKSAIVFSGALFISGALVLSFSSVLSMLIVGRFVLGIAVSVSVTAECAYISEISPSNRRGMLVSLNEVGITVGFLLAYLLNYLFISIPHGWKYVFGATIIPALLQTIGIIFMPQSPHYLIIKGKVDEAQQVLKRLRTDSNVDEEIKSIQSSLKEEKNRRYVDLMSSTNNMRKRLLLGIALVLMQQFSGNANVLYYAPSVFQRYGYCSNTSATLITIGLGVVKVIATLFTVAAVDKWGRRCFLLIGCFLMVCSLVALGLVAMTTAEVTKCSETKTEQAIPYTTETFDFDNTTTPGTEPVEATTLEYSYPNRTFYSNQDQDEEWQSTAVKLISAISIMTFVCAYSISYGPVTWLILSEIFPAALRGRAISVAVLANWGANLIVSLTFLNLLDSVGIGPTFLLYGCFCMISFICILLYVPETKNKSLEQISNELNKGFLQIHSCKPPQCCCFLENT